MVSDLWTAQDYAERKLDLTDGGRWTELHAGKVFTYSPPDQEHGDVVRNLLKAFSQYAHANNEGYAAFEIGIVTKRHPDTVRCPAASYFLAGERFAELDNLVATRVPILVVEIASSNDRRRNMDARVLEYHEAGIPLVWVFDTAEKLVHVLEKGRVAKKYQGDQMLYGGMQLVGFQTPVKEFFQEPSWWQDKQPKNGKG